MNIKNEAEALFPQLQKWRRHFHANPELSFREKATADYIVQELEKIDPLVIERNVGGGFGIVATMTTGAGPTIAIRADMDALPIIEENNHEFTSSYRGIMHACGHDAHMSMLLGAVHLLSEQCKNGELIGTVKFIFQPAEEATDDNGLSGAPYMIQSGALENVDAVIALHVCPWHPVQVIQMNHGYSMANVDVFRATIKATGGHGGYPHLATDPLWMLGMVLPAFYGVIGRRISPLDVAAASIGKVKAGSASNIIPQEVMIEGTIRSYYPRVRRKMAEEIESVFRQVEAFGGKYTFNVENGEPALNNHKEVNMLLERAIHDIYPDITLHWAPFGMGGEDFGYMTDYIPGAMFFLGCAINPTDTRDLHTSTFDIDENCLPIGAAIFSRAVQIFLGEKASMLK